MIVKIFPFIGWFKDYNTSKLKQDIIAGLTVALILIPQSMAYAQLAGLPAHYGLFASFIPPIVASLFGSSFQLSTGPVAIVSLMTSATLEPLAIAGTQGFIEYAIVLALIVGIFQFSLGVFRLGLVVNFMSHPVIIGFTNAAAIIIAASQLTKLLGIYVDDSEHFYMTIYNIVLSAIDYIHLPTFLMGFGAIIIIVFLHKISPKIPAVLIAVVVATIISKYVGFEHNYFAKIDEIKSENYQALIKQFNKETESITQDMKEHTTVLDKIDAMRDATTNFIKLLDMEYYDEFLGYKMGNEKSASQILRDKLRKYRFEAVALPNGVLNFYEKGNVPIGLKSDNRAWLLRVANQPLKLSNLSMKGGGGVVGDIPKGLPSFTIPTLNFKIFWKLFPYAVIISLLGFMEAISIAKAMAAKTGQTIDPNQELIGQGLANIIGAFGKSYPVSGSFSRSAVNLQAGATTGFSSIVTSLFVVFTLFYLTPLLHPLPKAVLAAIIMVAVAGLINFKSIKKTWITKWYDGLIAVITFIATLYFAPHLDKGIFIGIGLSLFVFLYKSMRPKITCLSMGSDFSMKSAEDYRLKQCSLIAAIRFDGTLFYANASYLEEKVLEIILKKPNLKHILIVANGINDIDSSGAENLNLLIKRVHSAGYGISMSGVNEKVLRVMKRARLIKLLGAENIYPTQMDALEDIFFKTHKAGSTDVYGCPLLNYIPEERKKSEDKKIEKEKRLEELESKLVILTRTIGTSNIRREFEERKKSET